MSELAILTPVLGRPLSVAPLLDFIALATPSARVVFIADPDDESEIAAIREQTKRIETDVPTMRVDCLLHGGNYAQKIQEAIRQTDEPYVFLGADDLEPTEGWFEAAKSAMTGDIQVVGVNDGIERGREHTTHFLLTREYAETPCIDGSPGPIFAGYGHNFIDDELIATAMSRNAYAYVSKALVVHRHPMAKTAPDDETYRRGRRSFARDRRIYNKRCPLWT